MATLLQHDSDKTTAQERNVFVIDFGDGKMETVAMVDDSGIYEVMAIDGDTNLGGLDIDYNLVEFCRQEFLNETGIEIKNDARAMRRLKNEVEKAKKVLSDARSVEIIVDALSDGEDFTLDMTRDKFEDINKAVFEKIELIMLRCIQASDIRPEDFTDIILVGGSTKIPRVQEIVHKIFKDKKIEVSLHADAAVAQGAAKIAHQIENKNVEHVTIEASSGSFCYKDNAGQFVELIPRN